MTLEQFTTNQNITLTLQKVKAEQLNAELKVKELLHEIKQVLNVYQSDFTWR
jgi:hypothetical protein